MENGKRTFSTISTNQEWSTDSLFDILSVSFFNNASSDVIGILFKTDKLGAQLDECSISLDMRPEYLFSVVLSKQDAICLFKILD